MCLKVTAIGPSCFSALYDRKLVAATSCNRSLDVNKNPPVTWQPPISACRNFLTPVNPYIEAPIIAPHTEVIIIITHSKTVMKM